MKVSSDGHFSGVAKLDLAGQDRGALAKGRDDLGLRHHAEDPGPDDRRRPGHAARSRSRSDYQLEYPFVVKYPIDEIPEKKLMLDFHGPFATTLR